MRGWRSSALNVALMQVSWFACVLGAARGLPWAGPAAVAVLGAAHLRLLSRRPLREGLFIAGAAVYGFLLETALGAGGALRPVQGSLPFPLAPLWMTALWANFATLVDHSLGWLRGRPGLAAALGALGGPLAYGAGESLGAVSLARPWGILALAAAWAASLPLLCAVAARVLGPVRPRGGKALSPAS